jgi:type IV secretion system protein VirD4
MTLFALTGILLLVFLVVMFREGFGRQALIALALTIVAGFLQKYAAQYVLDLAGQLPDRWWRYQAGRFSVTAGDLAAAAEMLTIAGMVYVGMIARMTALGSVGGAALAATETVVTENHYLATYHPTHYALVNFWLYDDWYGHLGFIACLFSSVVVLKAVIRAPEAPLTVRRAASNLHGASDWFPIKHALKWFERGGIVIGEAYRPDLNPKLGGTAPLLRYDGAAGSGHCLLFAGSGGFKTTATGIPTALEWPGGLVYLDPSAEVYPMVYAARREKGHRVLTLNPEDPASDGFNVLGWIDPSSDRALTDIQSVISWLAGEKPAELQREGYEDYFRQAAKSLLSCILADILFSDLPAKEKTLATLRRRVAVPIPDLRQYLNDIYAKGLRYGFGFPAEQAGNLKDITDKQFAGFYGEAGNLTQWLSIPRLSKLVCGSNFSSRHLLTGKVDVFINVPLKVLQATPQVCRLILGALLNAVYEAGGADGRILFLLDEVARLGYMSILETARDEGRKYGINLCLLYQSLGQLTATWGVQGRQAWFDSAYLKLFASVQDVEVAEYVSRACGEFTAISESSSQGSGRSSSSNTRHQSTSEQFVRRSLISAAEVLHNLRYDEQIVLIPNAPPLRCGRAIYFRRGDLSSRVNLNGYSVLPAARS